MKHSNFSLTAVVVSSAIALSCVSSDVMAQGQSHSPDIKALVKAGEKTNFEKLEKSLGTPNPSKKAELCYVTRTLANQYWKYEVTGFVAEAKKLGVAYHVYSVTGENSINEQLNKAQIALNQGCSAILASPISASALNSVFREAIKQGIPAIVLNDAKSSVPGTVYVGPDAVHLGEMAAGYIASHLPNGGNVAELKGAPGSSNAINRGKGFEKGLSEHKSLKLVAAQTADWNTNKAENIAGYMLTSHPDLKAIYSQNDDMGLGVETAVAGKDKTGKVLIIGNDGIPQAKKLIAAGKYSATVSERPITESKMGVLAALWLLEGKSVPSWVDVPGLIIDKKNVSKYLSGMP